MQYIFEQVMPFSFFFYPNLKITRSGVQISVGGRGAQIFRKLLDGGGRLFDTPEYDICH